MAFSGIKRLQLMLPDGKTWFDVGHVYCSCRILPHPRKPQVDPELVIEAIEYTYQARCRRV